MLLTRFLYFIQVYEWNRTEYKYIGAAKSLFYFVKDKRYIQFNLGNCLRIFSYSTINFHCIRKGNMRMLMLEKFYLQLYTNIYNKYMYDLSQPFSLQVRMGLFYTGCHVFINKLPSY